MKFRSISVLFLLGFLQHTMLGCQGEVVGNTDAAADASRESILRRGNGGDPGTLDPSLAEDVHAFSVLRDLYEGLLVETADGSIVPGVAARWDVSADGRRYTFHIRSGARWSNGEPVVAGNFVAGFRRTLSSESVSPYSFLLDPILHAAEVTAGERPVTDLGVRAINAETLEIELSSPAGYFPGVLAMPIAYPLYDGPEFDSRQFGNPEFFIGNGPYLLKERRPGYPIRLERNEQFRNAAEVNVQYVEYFPIENADTEYNMYRARELDITATIPPAKFASLRSERPDELLVSPNLALYYLAFDLSEPPLNDVVLRQALSMAIDRETLVEIIGRGEQAAFGIVPDGVAWHVPARYAWQSASRSARESQAKVLYADAGFNEENSLKFTLMYDVGDIHETVAVTVASMWSDVLGADIALDKREWKYFLDTRENRADWQVMRFSWFGDYNDATTFLDIFQSDSPQNLPRYRDRRYDSLLDQASQSLDSATRTSLLHDAEARLLDAYAVAPLYFYVSKHLVNPSVRNFAPNVLDVHPSRFLDKVAPRSE